MKIAVCIKQVPADSDGQMDPVRGVLIRNGNKQVMNIYDASALETALRLKERQTSMVDIFTMGPESAKQVVMDAYSLGADHGFLISDKQFAGADSLATSYTLAQAIKLKGPYDMIICGKQTTDGDTGQVGASIAAWLQWPYLGQVSGIEELSEDYIILWQNIGNMRSLTKVVYPCVLSVERDNFIPRMPGLRLKLTSAKKPISMISFLDMPDQEANHYGLKGSPTRVKRIYPQEHPEVKGLFCDEPAAIAYKIIDTLKEWGVNNG